MQMILMIVSILLTVFGAYSWFALGEFNGFQKGCYCLGVLLVAAGYFVLLGPQGLVATAVGCILILFPSYNQLREYMP